MNKNLIDLQRFGTATCAVIKNEDSKKLPYSVIMNAGISDDFLATKPFCEKLDDKSQKSELCYLVITHIDVVDKSKQDRFLGLVKDREFMGYNLPKNCIIVFTVNDENSLKNISPNLYHFCTLAL